MEDLEEILPYLSIAKIIQPNYDFSPHDFREKLTEVREADGQTYNLNNENHRGPDFVENADLLAIGCSVTYGIGLPQETTWPHRLAEELNLSTYNVLAFPGGSQSLILRQTIEYIYKYGKPKYLVALLPDNDRVDTFSFEAWDVFDYSNKEKADTKIRSVMLSAVTNDNNFLGANKRPINVRYPRYMAMSSFIQFMRFCELLDIKLVWSTWDNWDALMSKNYDYLKIDKYIRKTYEKVNDMRQNDLINMTCHDPDDDPHFYVGTDAVKHWGSHYHIHVAERLAHALRYKYGAKS